MVSGMTASVPGPAPVPTAGSEPGSGDDRLVPTVALSPSRISDFKTCPLLYRFRAIDRLPEPPTPQTARGTLVHAVLERLFDHPRHERTPSRARALAADEWHRMRSDDPEMATLTGDDAELDAWLAEAGRLIDTYFCLENPQLLDPADRELALEIELDEGIRLKGVIDRVDVAPTGQVRIVDYKTGRSPAAVFEQSALFQLRIYALLMWRARGRVPSVLQLVYLRDGRMVRLLPDEDDLRALERTLRAVATAITKARATGDFRPRTSRLCDVCPHRSRCPAWGGTPPPLASDTSPSTESGAAGDACAVHSG